MYEELVKLLKDKAERFDYDGWVDTAVVMEKAADAIEELSMKLHGDEAAIAGMKREIEWMVVAGKPRWISVKDRLPEKQGEEYLVSISYPNGETDRVVLWYDLGIEPFFWNRIFVPRGTITHWMPLPAPPQEGND